jgi:hypothetical protein
MDLITARVGVSNDVELCRATDIIPSYCSKIRQGKVTRVSAGMMLRIHEKFDIPVAEIRNLIALSGLEAYDAR